MLRESLLEYTQKEKKLIEDQIELLKTLPEEIQIEKGLLVDELTLVEKNGNELLFSVEVNNTKLKSGDKAFLIIQNRKFDAVIIENLATEISLIFESRIEIPKGCKCKLQISIPQLLDPIIESYKRLDEGAPGWYFIEMLSGIKPPIEKSIYSTISPDKVALKINKLALSETQKRIINKACNLPSYLGIQGPPGSGKSYILSVIADILNSEGKRVVVLSHTHQAVNNCLEAIHKQNPTIKLIKIGEQLKSKNLNASIETMSFFAFNQNLKKRKDTDLTIVGMTIYSAILNLGLKRNALSPNVILIDEAGQIPLSIGALIGLMGAGSNLFFGDDAQMPPIFQEELIDDYLSTSIFKHIRNINPAFIDKLDITYRMNKELTNFIGSNFYLDENTNETFLKASTTSRDRKLNVDLTTASEFEIECLNSEPSLVVIKDNESDGTFYYFNPIQANRIATLIQFLVTLDYPIAQIAVVTPFRKQVIEIKRCLNNLGLREFPIIDTVERVQGITVDIIIYSVCTTNAIEDLDRNSFIFSPNRINVAISRARLKAIVFGSIPYDYEQQVPLF